MDILINSLEIYLFFGNQKREVITVTENIMNYEKE